MAFKIADGYVEVHARHDRASTRRNAREAVDESDKVGKEREGSLLAWLFKSNPKIHKMLESPIGAIFGSPIIFAAAATAILGIAGFAATAISSAILLGIAGGFIAGGAWVHANDKNVVSAYKAMQKKIKDTFYEASKPIVGPMISAMNMIGDKVKSWQPAFTRIYEALAPLIEPFTGGVLGFIEAMLPGIERAMPGIQAMMLALADHLPGLGTAIGDFFATLADNKELLTTVVGLMITWLENFFKVAGPFLVFFMYAFAGMAAEWKYLMDALKAGWQWVDDTWHAIPGWWDETWGAVKGWFGDLWNTITTFFSDSGTAISTWWNDQISQISGWWSSTWGSVSTWFSELPGQIGGFLSSLPGTIGGWFQTAFDNVTYMIGFAIGTWVKNIIEFPGQVWAGLQAGFQLWMTGFQTVLDWIINYIVSSWNRGIEFWSTMPGRVQQIMLNLGTQVVASVVSMFTRAMAWWDQLPSRIWQAVQDAFNRALGVFNWANTEIPRRMTAIRDAVVGALLGLGGMLYNAGQDAIRGLIDGIGSMMGWAVDMAWRAALNIAQGFLDALDIGSPSKFFRDKVGKWIPAGIMVGIEDNMGDLNRFTKGFPDELTSGMRPPLAGSSSSTDNSTNYGGIKVEVHVDSIQELEDIKRFLDGQMKTDPKARTWAGNLYEQQGEYVRSYQ